MANALKDLAEAAKSVGGQVTEVIEEAAEQVGKAGDMGGDLARLMTEDVNRLLPAIKRAGYSVHGLDIDVAIPPKIVVHCLMAIEVPEGDREALLAELSDNKVSSMAVKALFRLSDVQKGLSLGELRPQEVLLEVGLSPAVRVRYRDASST